MPPDATPIWHPMRVTRNALPDDASSSEAVVYEVRRKIYPRAIGGVYARWRVAMVGVTQAVFYGMPWIQWNGRQAVLFDLGARKFYIGPLVLWPQDVIYLAVLLVICALSLFLFTAIAGRLWCGYACPQTVYTEIFLWIERRVEGERQNRIRLDAQPWGLRKLRIKATKHALWIAVGLWTGFTFVGYFTPIRDMTSQLAAWALSPWQAFWMLFYGFATWGNAGFLREQVCKHMCPYARFQSVMVDPDTYVVTYDHVRGEPRGPRSKKVDPRAAGLGDCVECSICVQVCPTGIDIKDGLQYDCIGCGACIDACDQVMDKMGYRRGLIRYTSDNAVRRALSDGHARRRILRPRIVIYATACLMLTAGLFVSLATRSPMRVDVIRDRGSLGREVPGGFFENVYSLQLMNASERAQHVTVRAEGLDGIGIAGTAAGALTLDVAPTSNHVVPLRVAVPVDRAAPGTHHIAFVVAADDARGGRAVVREASTFIVPK